MDHRKKRKDFPDLVPLDSADEMPLQRGWQRGDFWFRLLKFALTKRLLPHVDRLSNRARGKCLRDGDKIDGVFRTPGLAARGGNAVAYLGELG